MNRILNYLNNKTNGKLETGINFLGRGLAWVVVFPVECVGRGFHWIAEKVWTK